MTFKERIDALKTKFQSRIKEDSSQEEIDEVNSLVGELGEIENEHNQLSQEHAKTKEAIVRMVLNQGSSDKPGDDTDGSKPKTIEECVAEVQKGGK